MVESFPLERELPPAAGPAVAIVRALRDAGHEALLAGGCVRDLLLGNDPQDFDVATDATPERICGLFRPTRTVGATFGVVLVRRLGRWIEVATFRTDGAYLDGRRPSSIAFTTAEKDAQRRDFTVNGMFLDPAAGTVLDYVGGRADLAARVIRCIGVPAERFAEDYLRLLRAVRFAARLGFAIEPVTLAAIGQTAARLSQVAAERVREELEKMLAHRSRRRAVELLASTGLLSQLSRAAEWPEPRLERALQLLDRLPADAGFELGFAVLVHDQPARNLERIARELAFSNEQRTIASWLVAHQADLDEPARVGLAALKRLLARPWFGMLRTLAEMRYRDRPDAAALAAELARRVEAIPADRIQPPPLVTGDDLIARGVPAGPLYKRMLDALYGEQLDETLMAREQAFARLDELLAQAGPYSTPPG